MSGTYVTDITHYLDDKGELPAEMPGAARKLASFLVLVIARGDSFHSLSSLGHYASDLGCRVVSGRAAADVPSPGP
jgi:hypothetical protein